MMNNIHTAIPLTISAVVAVPDMKLLTVEVTILIGFTSTMT
jgi:hypothetical protein